MSDRMIAMEAELVIKRTTDAALVELPDGEEIWFPLSQCGTLEFIDEGDGGEFSCPEWLLAEKGLESYIE